MFPKKRKKYLNKGRRVGWVEKACPEFELVDLYTKNAQRMPHTCHFLDWFTECLLKRIMK